MEFGLAELVWPMSCLEFRERIWPDRPYVAGPSNELRKAMASIPEFANPEALIQGCPTATAWPPPGLQGVPFKPVPDQLVLLYRAGFTLFFTDMERHLKTLIPTIRRLEQNLDLRCGEISCQATIVPAGSGTPVHFDSNIGFNVQLSGTKRWRIAPNVDVEYPHEGHAILDGVSSPYYSDDLRSYAKVHKASGMGEGTQEYAVRPGNVVFLPMGFWHSTIADEPSFAVIFSVRASRWSSLLARELEDILIQQPEARRPALGLGQSNGESLKLPLLTVFRRVREWADSLDENTLLKKWGARSVSTALVPRLTSIADAFVSELAAVPVIENPFPWYGLLRKTRTANVRSHNVWLVSDYANCLAILGNATCFGDWDAADLFQEGGPPSVSVAETGVIPDGAHSARQILFYKALNVSSRLKSLDAQISSVTNDIIDTSFRNARVDVVNGFAVPLVGELVGRMFGFPNDEWIRFFREYLEYLRPPASPARYGVNGITAVGVATLDFRERMREELKCRRFQPRDDVISSIIHATTDTEMFPDEDIIKLCQLVARNAAITTTDLIGNALWCITGCKDVSEELSRNPALVSQAIEETLRMESPVQILSRRSMKAVRQGTLEVPSGARLLVLIAAANRDEEIFSNPDRFDLHRHNSGANLAFGFGINACLAAAIARRVATRSVQAILARLPNLRLSPGHPNRHRGAKFNRGFDSLAMEWDA